MSNHVQEGSFVLLQVACCGVEKSKQQFKSKEEARDSCGGSRRRTGTNNWMLTCFSKSFIMTTCPLQTSCSN